MKKIAVLGTGMVGSTIGTKMIELGHQVKMGSRTADNAKAQSWVLKNGSEASQGTFQDAVLSADIIFNCIRGANVFDAISLVKADSLEGKTLVDVSNPLDFSNGMPPTILPHLCNTNSLGEEIQKLLPATNVVKTLNIVNCEVMVDAGKCGGTATMFVAGDNLESKDAVTEILKSFNWVDIIDLGGIEHARSLEMMLPIWLSTYTATKNGFIGFKIVRS